ncbi:hypothetical protein D3C81_1360370 [compost metagenome]
MPVVSHSVMPAAPASAKRVASAITASAPTSPSKGQPNTVDSEMLTGTPAALAASIIASSCACDCSRVMRRLARLWVSLADITRLTSSGRHDSARSRPRRLGTSTV